MNNNIYVNDNNVIYNYEVSFDRKEFERVIDDIDVWYGKGELKSFIGRVCPEYPGKKTDVFAEVALFDDNNKEFFFYQYIQHPLIRILANWNCESDEERSFVVRLMSCFTFSKMNLGDVMLLDLTEEDKRNLFDRVVDAFKKRERESFIVAGSSEFCSDLEKATGFIISDKEELLGGYFKGREEDKKFTKKRYIMALPTSKDINK